MNQLKILKTMETNDYMNPKNWDKETWKDVLEESVIIISFLVACYVLVLLVAAING